MVRRWAQASPKQVQSNVRTVDAQTGGVTDAPGCVDVPGPWRVQVLEGTGAGCWSRMAEPRITKVFFKLEYRSVIGCSPRG